MAKKNKKKQLERDRKQQQWRREDQTIRDFRAKAPYMKAFLRNRECKLPFYDYLDSYVDEFQRTVAEAKAAHPSLLGIHEVDDNVFSQDNADWSQLGYRDLRQVFFSIQDDVADYGAKSLDANLCGSMSAFYDATGTVRTVILIRQSVKASVQHRELKYALKIASLVHEVGHVEDLERQINFDVPNQRLDVIEAEVFAHLFALNQLTHRNLGQSFNMLVGGLRDAIPAGGYTSQVAQRVLDRLPDYELIDWQRILDVPPTPEELKRLGPKGIAALNT